MDMDSSSGANKLGQAIADRIVKHMEGESSLVLDFGEIKGDESLVTNTFPIPIPKGDYHVLRQLTLGKKDDVFAKTQNTGKDNSGKHTHEFQLQAGPYPVTGIIKDSIPSRHVHDIIIPELMRSLKSGDRVLVAWVQNEAVVIDIVVSS